MSISWDQRVRETDSWVTPRRIAWVLGSAVLAIAVLLGVRLTQSFAAKRAITNKSGIPTVTVTEAGRSAVPTTVSIIGTIGARYDTPIGVEGDGGRVSAIYAEAGDHVKRGQILARLDSAVLEPQVTNLEAALELARAEAELAAAEYHRAVAVGKSGALSAEETERRRSSSVTAAAKVKVAAAQLAEAQARLARMEVRAPADGTILTRTVEVGQTATPGGGALFRMAEGDEVELRGEVAEQDLPALKVGQVVSVRLTGTSKAYPGQVRLLGAVIDPQTRLGIVRVSLTPDPEPAPGRVRARRSHRQQRRAYRVAADRRAHRRQGQLRTDRRLGRAKSNGVRCTCPESSMHGVTIDQGVSDKDQVVATAGAFLQVGETVRAVSSGS